MPSARALAASNAERDLFRMGARPEHVDLIDEIARRSRSGNVTAAEVLATAEREVTELGLDDLAFALERALGPDMAGSARALGKLFAKLRGPWVQDLGKEDGSTVWRLNWPRRCWTAPDE